MRHVRVAIMEDAPGGCAKVLSFFEKDPSISIIARAPALPMLEETCAMLGARPDVIVIWHGKRELSSSSMGALSECGGIPILVLLGGLDWRLAGTCLSCGVRGVLALPTRREQLLDAVRGVARGLIVVDGRFVKRFRSVLSDIREPGGCEGLKAILTPREKELVEHVASGLGNGEIACLMAIERGSVKRMINRVLHKSGLHSRLELALRWRGDPLD